MNTISAMAKDKPELWKKKKIQACDLCDHSIQVSYEAITGRVDY